MQPPKWFYPTVALAALVIAGALVLDATRAFWVPAEHGLVNQRTGEVCIAKSEQRALTVTAGEALALATDRAPLTWLCSTPPRHGASVSGAQ